MAVATLSNSRTGIDHKVATTTSAAGKKIASRGQGISKTDLLVVTTQLSIMCQSGVDLAAALSNIAQESRHAGLKPILKAVSNDVNSGVSASAALRKHADVFGNVYVASIASAEAAGTLNSVLQRLCELLKNEIRMRNAILSIIAYPIVLIAVAVVVVSALVFFVLPQFSKVFVNLGKPAPVYTQILLDSASFARDQAHWLGGILAVIAFGLFQFSRTEEWRRYKDQLVLHAPLFRSASRSLLTGRTFRLLGMLLESGVPLLESIRLCQGTVKNRLFNGLLRRIEHEVTNGRGMSQEVARSEFVPSGAAQMVLTAERNGKLSSVLQLIGQHYEEEGEQFIKSAMRVIEPAVIVLMGIVVGGVVLCVMLPLLDVTTAGQ